MKRLKDFQNEINKCSKCGLCQSACPIFEITKNECAVSKGKFAMLQGVLLGKLKLSKKINNYVDMCLKCEKCNDFCPVGINVSQILNCAKYEYMRNRKEFLLISFLESRQIFNSIIKFFEIVSNPFRPKLISKKNGLNLLYFKGCVNKMFPNTDKYLSKIFKNSDINISSPDFECCGLPFLSEGNLERFEQVAEHNIKLLNGEYDYVVTDCASCENTVLSYDNYFENCVPHKEKFLNWGDIVAKENLKFKSKKNITVTFHKPCHLKDDSFFEKIMANCKNVSYIKMKDYDKCCGLAGSFFLKNPKLSNQMMKEKSKNIKQTNADYVITTCPACILGLKKSLGIFSKTKVVSLLEFLSKLETL